MELLEVDELLRLIGSIPETGLRNGVLSGVMDMYEQFKSEINRLEGVNERLEDLIRTS